MLSQRPSMRHWLAMSTLRFNSDVVHFRSGVGGTFSGSNDRI